MTGFIHLEELLVLLRLVKLVQSSDVDDTIMRGDGSSHIRLHADAGRAVGRVLDLASGAASVTARLRSEG